MQKTALSIQLQDRDLAILRGLLESRIMTAKHIAVLYFDGSRESAKKRLQKLKAAGFIAERVRRVNEPSILFLTRRALSELKAQGVLSNYPDLSLKSFEKRIPVSALTLRHELEVMDVKAAFYAGVRDCPQLTIAEFSTWPLLYQFESGSVGYNGSPRPVKPDGFVRFHENLANGDIAEHTYFLEVDRSSETLETLVTRAELYRDYYRTGGFAARHGANLEDYKSFPFRVLMVFKSEERRNNVAERLLHCAPPILSLVWVTTFTEVVGTPLGEIGIQPSDFREFLPEVPPDVSHQEFTGGYRRRSIREVLIRKNIQKRALFGS
jgi:hypothetical protein